MTRVTVWGEGFLDLSSLDGAEEPLNYANYLEQARRLHPDEIHGTIANGLREIFGDSVAVRTSTLDDPECGLSQQLLDETDVLVWFSHVKQEGVDDDAVERVVNRVVDGGMGFVALHSGAFSKIFIRLMGTSCRTGGWRQADDWEAIWTVNADHPIARGVPAVFVLPSEEVWTEYFDIPQPDELVFVSSFQGGEIFRSGCCFVRGNGRIFYFRPGHDNHPTFHIPAVKQVLANAVEWAGRTVSSSIYRGLDVVSHELDPVGWFHHDGATSE